MKTRIFESSNDDPSFLFFGTKSSETPGLSTVNFSIGEEKRRHLIRPFLKLDTPHATPMKKETKNYAHQHQQPTTYEQYFLDGQHNRENELKNSTVSPQVAESYETEPPPVTSQQRCMRVKCVNES